jgi:hypothetical protein
MERREIKKYELNASREKECTFKPVLVARYKKEGGKERKSGRGDESPIKMIVENEME